MKLVGDEVEVRPVPRERGNNSQPLDKSKRSTFKVRFSAMSIEAGKARVMSCF